MRFAEAGDLGKDGVSRSGHRDCDRAEVEGRPGETGRRLGETRGRGSLVPRVYRSGERPDHPKRHGRASPRHQGRHSQTYVQSRRQYRCAAGGFPRKDHASC